MTGTASNLRIAQSILAAYETRKPIAPIRDLVSDPDVDAAYAIQEINTRAWSEGGRRLVGHKIGLTSPVVQKQFGVDQPDFGMLFADMAAGEGMPIAMDRLLQPKIEAEVALILERDLDVEQPNVADIVRATAYVVPALEIVDSRIADWNIRIFDTVADNASAGLFVLGGPARRLDGLDLRGCKMSMTRSGESVSEGSGAACLGHPLNAACWLAGQTAKRGRPLRAGDIVLTGALGPMVPVKAGDTFNASIVGLGHVTAVFAEG